MAQREAGISLQASGVRLDPEQWPAAMFGEISSLPSLKDIADTPAFGEAR